MTSRTRRLWIGAILGPLSWSLAGCEQPHPQTSPASELRARQMRKLAERILENTPEHTHFSWPAFFRWVLVSPEIDKNPPDLNQEVLHLLKARYTVYTRKQDVPERFVHKDQNGTLQGYEGGFDFKFIVVFEDEITVKVKYSDYEGNMAASFHWKRYRWTGGNWKIIEKSGMLVS
jgi:hypothetical protein